MDIIVCVFAVWCFVSLSERVRNFDRCLNFHPPQMISSSAEKRCTTHWIFFMMISLFHFFSDKRRGSEKFNVWRLHEPWRRAWGESLRWDYVPWRHVHHCRTVPRGIQQHTQEQNESCHFQVNLMLRNLFGKKLQIPCLRLSLVSYFVLIRANDKPILVLLVLIHNFDVSESWKSVLKKDTQRPGVRFSGLIHWTDKMQLLWLFRRIRIKITLFYVVGPHSKCLENVILMSTHKIGFHLEISKIFPYSLSNMQHISSTIKHIGSFLLDMC